MLRFIIYFRDRVLPLLKSLNLGAVQQTLSIQPQWATQSDGLSDALKFLSDISHMERTQLHCLLTSKDSLNSS